MRSKTELSLRFKYIKIELSVRFVYVKIGLSFPFTHIKVDPSALRSTQPKNRLTDFHEI